MFSSGTWVKGQTLQLKLRSQQIFFHTRCQWDSTVRKSNFHTNPAPKNKQQQKNLRPTTAITCCNSPASTGRSLEFCRGIHALCRSCRPRLALRSTRERKKKAESIQGRIYRAAARLEGGKHKSEKFFSCTCGI